MVRTLVVVALSIAHALSVAHACIRVVPVLLMVRLLGLYMLFLAMTVVAVVRGSGSCTHGVLVVAPHRVPTGIHASSVRMTHTSTTAHGPSVTSMTSPHHVHVASAASVHIRRHT